jgi:hypothetical protein
VFRVRGNALRLPRRAPGRLRDRQDRRGEDHPSATISTVISGSTSL